MTKRQSGIPVHCTFDKLVPLDELKANPRNPNKHPKAQVELLASIIEKTGWRHPIVVSKRSGFIVNGHCRKLAAVKLGAKDAPVDYQDFITEAEEMAALMADNRVAELAEPDKSLTIDLLKELSAGGGTDFLMAGYTSDALNELLNEDALFDELKVKPSPGHLWVLLAIPIKYLGEVREALAVMEEYSDISVKTNRD